MIPGTLSWNDSGNNKAYQSGQIGLTFNGVSIYYTCKSSPDPAVQAIAALRAGSLEVAPLQSYF
jgi:multiple sugar transport system substrate-binding protein